MPTGNFNWPNTLPQMTVRPQATFCCASWKAEILSILNSTQQWNTLFYSVPADFPLTASCLWRCSHSGHKLCCRQTEHSDAWNSKTAVGQLSDSQQPQQNHTCATTLPSTMQSHVTLLTLPQPERRQPALSVTQAWKRCFLENPRDALVVCAAALTRKFDYFVGATCARGVVARPKLRSLQMLTKSPAFYGTPRFTALFTAACPFSHIHSIRGLLYYVSNSLTSITPTVPTYPTYRQVSTPKSCTFSRTRATYRAQLISFHFTTFIIFV
jgi:hypothetical protein